MRQTYGAAPAALVVMLALAGAQGVSAEKGSYVDSVRFIQYLDESVALEEVRNGNIDLYYGRISPDRLAERSDREGLQVFDSAGGSYSILMNPAKTERFNPFSEREIRFAINYLVDRRLFVNELMGGYGTPIVSAYGPSSPDYLNVIEQTESFNFRYNPALAESIITEALMGRGAVKEGGVWTIDSEPIELTFFIRSDDPIRKSIGTILAAELEGIGFTVRQDFGDLNKAFAVVYGSDPADLKWSLYTEGWGSSAFVRYDTVRLAQMYSPWFSNMPGFNDPSYWNYENNELDELTQSLYAANFTDASERAALIQDGITGGVMEAVRVFLIDQTSQYVAGSDVSGVINDLGAGVPTRFTPINARTGDGELDIGVKQIYQGAWNTVRGLTDVYSVRIWNVISDPGAYKHPFTGDTFPVRAKWQVETAGPSGRLDVPQDAVMWDTAAQSWKGVPEGTTAVSMASFEYELGSWHHGRGIDMNDIMYSLYFVKEWGTQDGNDDRTVDPEFTARVSQTIDTIVGARITGDDTMEVYVDYWHFDSNEIASWALIWPSTPWEITAAMEDIVLDGEASFSRSDATAKGIGWLSLIIPNDASLVESRLNEFGELGYVPPALPGLTPGQAMDRYDASAEWIRHNDHAVISNGPFYLDSYIPESRTMRVSAFDDAAYPFEAGRWSDFEHAMPPRILGMDLPGVVAAGEPLEIAVRAGSSDSVIYFLTDARGSIISSGTAPVSGGSAAVRIGPEHTSMLEQGTGSIKAFAVSESVLKPDLYESSFLVADAAEIPRTGEAASGTVPDRPAYGEAGVAAALAVAAAGILAYVARRRLRGRVAQR